MPSESVAWYQHFGYNFKRRKLSGAYSTPASHPVFWGPWQWYSRVQWRIYGAGDHIVKAAFIIIEFWSRRQQPSNHFWFLRYLICIKLTHCRISAVSFEKCIQCSIKLPPQSRYRTVPSFVKVPLYLFVVNHFLQIKSLRPLDLFFVPLDIF